MIVTKYRIAEQAARIIHGGDVGVSSEPSIGVLMVAAGQVINKLLKTDYMQTNLPMQEFIPNGGVLGLYENIVVESWNGKSRASLPIKPLKMPRDMGVFAVYPAFDGSEISFDKEFIPLQMGQSGHLKSQRLISDLLGQIGYEVYGGQIVFTKDIKSLWPEIKLAMRLVVLDIDQYSNWDMLPIPAEMEADVIQAIVAMYKGQGVPDKTVDPAVSEQKDVPINQQKLT